MDLASLVAGLILGIQVSVVFIAVIAYRSKPAPAATVDVKAVSNASQPVVEEVKPVEKVNNPLRNTKIKAEGKRKKGRMPSWWYRDLGKGKGQGNRKDEEESIEDSRDEPSSDSGSFTW